MPFEGMIGVFRTRRKPSTVPFQIREAPDGQALRDVSGG